MSNTRTIIGLLLAAIICIALVGCGGGSGGSDVTVGSKLNISTDTVMGIDTLASKVQKSATVVAPLTAGTVTVYDFKTGDTITTGTLDSNGNCSVEITPGLSVVIVAEGTRDGKSYRLSTLIAAVPSTDSDVPVNPETSIAAEAISEKHYAKGEALDPDMIAAVLAAAQEFAQNHSTADYSIGGGVFAGNKFGAAGSLSGDLQAIKDLVPDGPPDNNVVAAKNAVFQIKQAGVPLAALTDQELPDLKTVFTDEVQSKYTAFTDRFQALIAPSLGVGSGMYYNEEEVTIHDLTLGKAYNAVYQNEWGWSWLELTDAGSTTAGRILITLTDGGVTSTLTAVKSGSNWTLTQKSSADSTLSYVVTLPDAVYTINTNPRINVTANMVDKYFPTGIKFSGDFSADSTDGQHFNRMSFNGSLTSPQVAATGNFEVHFPATAPAGTTEDAYHFPTSITMNNASITATGSNGTVIKLAGSISGTAVIVQGNDGPESLPKHIALTGSYSNSHSKLAFNNGEIVADWASPAISPAANKINATLNMHGELIRTGYAGYYADVKSSLNDGIANIALDLRVGTNTLKGSGSGTIDANGHAVGTPNLKLINQDGVEFVLNGSDSGVTGAINVGTGKIKAADITTQSSSLKIAYTDDTIDIIPL